MTYKDLTAALAEFDLPQQVTLKKVRERHRQLVRRYHPDTGQLRIMIKFGELMRRIKF